MKKREFISFKDQMKKTLIFYSLIPLLLISFMGYCSVYLTNYLVVKKENQEINKVLSKKMDIMISEAFEKIDILSQNKKIIEELVNGKITSATYQEIYSNINDIELKGNLIIYDKNKNSCANIKRKYLTPENVFNYMIFTRMENHTNKVIGITGRFYFLDGEESDYCICKAIVKDNEIVGYLTYYLSDAYLKEIVGKYSQNTIILVDKYNNIIMTTNESFRNGINKIGKKLQVSENYSKIDNNKYFISKRKIYYSNMSIYCISSLDYIIKSFFDTFIYSIFALFILTFIMAKVVRRVAINKTKAMEEVISGIEKLKKGDLDTKLIINSNDEFQIIADSYNKMLESIKDLIEKNKEETKHSIISEIKQLESQFNPHFLFNTLEMLKYTIKTDTLKANKIILNISSILRFSIENKSSEVTIARNMFYIKNYLEIQKFRFGEKFQYEIKMEEKLEEVLSPKLIMQPIIENSIKYGFNQEKIFKINIFIKEIRNNLIIIIYDNGKGMRKEELNLVREKLNKEKLETKEHIGLYNVQRRIKLMYGENYKLIIRSVLNKGTFTKIILPISKGENNDKNTNS
ncbi:MULTISPECIES: sensor histidine kinase [Fusobacterium]|uniref:sensor histidine kinase n=1 Tax=Fusobacterium TaxID=848 RepID=UPI0014768779|nr:MULTISPECIES: histidine kinase [Fusobacterium]NME36799.1 histidine kinase [Fusobacterium sp. FSA-380-WT-3A]